MKRATIVLSVTCVFLGCHSAGRQSGPWSMTGPQRVPPPATGSVGRGTKPLYDQFTIAPKVGISSSGATSVGPSFPGEASRVGRFVAPANRANRSSLTRSKSTSAELSVPRKPATEVKSSQKAPGSAASVSSGYISEEQTAPNPGWRSPQHLIQPSNVQLSNLPEKTLVPSFADRSVPSSKMASVSFSPRDQSVLVRGPIRIVEPVGKSSAGKVAIRPMPMNDAMRVAQEPDRFRAPGQLPEITHLQRTQQSMMAGANGNQPDPSRSTALNPTVPTTRVDSTQWRPTIVPSP